MCREWYVIDTPMYPCRWKVVNDHYRQDNASINYFARSEEAQAEANSRNEQEIQEEDYRRRCQQWPTPPEA